MKSLLEYAPKHLITEVTNEVPVLSGILPVSLTTLDAPIQPSKAEWEYSQNPEFISRLFEFVRYQDLKYFLDNLLDYQERFQHHAEILIEEKSIYVKSYTHDLDAVTELDIALSKFCDEVYEDLAYVERLRKERVYASNE